MELLGLLNMLGWEDGSGSSMVSIEAGEMGRETIVESLGAGGAAL